MTATEELRRMLDERGVEYEAPHAGFTIVRTDNAVCKFYEMLEEPERGVFAVVTTDWLTPEQAIAATLGDEGVGRSNDGVAELQAGTCHNIHEPPRNTTFWPTPHFKCSECGEVHVSMQYVFYCPNCGRKVVDDG